MKRIIQAMVVAALFTGAQAQADDAAIGLPSQWTYADRHAAEIVQGGSLDAFPGNGDPVVLPSMSTYADEHAAELAQGGSLDAFPGNGDPVDLPSMSTYADLFVTERNDQARGASDPALSE